MSKGLDIEVRDLRMEFGDTVAVDDLSCRLAGGKIYGLLGRNGAGKTTLLAVLAAFRKATAGAVLVDGEDPFENTRLMRDICFVREGNDGTEQLRVRTALSFASTFRPHWDQAYADRLIERFELPLRKRVGRLSLGQRSAMRVVIGLASRCPLTIFDEAYLGMDAPSRYSFYEEVLNDYLDNPRTVILSTHLIEEFGSLFEEVLILDRGRLLVHEDTDTLRERGTTVTGPAGEVDAYVAGMTVLNEQRLGGTKAVTVNERLDADQRRQAIAAGLELGPVALQDLFIHLTERNADREKRP
ncbi:ATP-binding cassette domain-containing protein [Fodinicola acaciae]|uniref:ATP-binding cassette domain-containing protein n=1 Tax=Fodinicola acaciae TaxID=2681555 RepID=UPI0013D8BF11|nr:ABC transporter ATP-binding protein [Fodinicola acaciae]